MGGFSVGVMFTTLAEAVAEDLSSLPAEPVDGLGEADVLDALVTNRRVKNLAEAHDLVLVARYCQLNATADAIAHPAETYAGGERLVHPGGDGTRPVREFAVADLAARLGRSHDTTLRLVTDVLDLVYRLPLLWRRVLVGRVEPWRARQIATASHPASWEAARRVDAEVYSIAASVGPKRLAAIVAAAVIAADPDHADRLAERAADSRQVRVDRSSQQGLKDVFIRADAADVIRFDAAVDLVADLLHADGVAGSKQVRRAKAIGVLADPVQVLDLYERTRDQRLAQWLSDRAESQASAAEAADQPPEPAAGCDPIVDSGVVPNRDPVADQASFLSDREPDLDPGDAVADFDVENPATVGSVEAWLYQLDQTGTDVADLEPPDPDPFEPPPPAATAPPDMSPDRRGPVTSPAVTDVRTAKQPKRRRRRGRRLRSYPAVTLVLHMSADSFYADTRDPARLEHPGYTSVPLTTEQAADLLGHSRVHIQPVLDLNDTTPVDAYEVTGQLRQKVTIISAGVCPFPYCDTSSRHRQCDHTINWPDGPSGVGNLSVPDPGHHRVKTHSRWQVRQPFPNIFIWKDPYGRFYLVDHRGTHTLPRQVA